ncbi:pyocin knob domain-containing protein [Lactobacillus crispatus]|uniref:pyocin knob domain-containing protein n=1 Tax=Lactobacillus crispatus TaxID=47770 RepID=UPI0018E367F5|nr:pyocin knob domain-containing protein [Lactobacillus crispatus]MBI1713329.1 phage-like protein [Lactobacillus crispatus]
MSTIRDPAYITDAGRTMMTAGGDVTYTKAVLYGQDISHLTSDQVKALTTIGSPLREVKVGISDKQNTDRGTTVILEATFQNDNLANDLPYTAVGFFAQKGNDEKLIAVAVANTGAYLTATSPDGIATDALDLKLAIAIGDATNVTATVDPAGSVTPATLNGAINETKQVLTALIDTKASQSNLDQTNAEVAKKADSEAVNSQLATKANTTDIDKQVKTLNDAINTKADKATVDAEIGKIDFTPYAKTVDVDSKVKTVTDLANTKDSTADVDAKIKDVTDKVNTKADQSNVNNQVQDAKNAATSRADNLQSQVNNLKGARTANSPDFDSLTDSGPYYVTNPEKGKNSPCGGIWGTLIISNGADHRIVQTYYPDNDDSPFYRMKVYNNWQPWRQMAKMIDISNLQNQINTKHNIATPLFREIQNSNSWQDIFGVGNPNSVLTSIRIDAGGSGPLLNDFAAGVGFGGADTKGVLSVGYHNNQARITGGNGNGPVWSEDIAWKSDINSLLNTITTLQNQVNDLINQINYIKQNYLQGKRFPANQEAQAQQWENNNPNGIAMIEK